MATPPTRGKSTPAPIPAASVNILESRRRICDSGDSTHGLLSRSSASATGFTSVCLPPRAASLMPRGREAFPETIGLVEVHLVGCLSTESIVRHSGIVLVDVEIDELLELREAFERMQVQPLMASAAGSSQRPSGSHTS